MYNAGKGRVQTAFIIIGVLFFVLAAGLLSYKQLTGYHTVTKLGTFGDCTVKTEEISGEGGRVSRSSYIVEVSCEGEGLHFRSDTDRHFYDRFRRYTSKYVTFYKDENGELFPTYTADCGEREAEKEYRHIKPPVQWYPVYSILGFIGLCFCASPLANKIRERFPGLYTNP